MAARRTEYLAMTPALRARLEATVEHLIALLDAIDGDVDLESTADEEPYLSAGARTWSSFDADHLEDDAAAA